MNPTQKPDELRSLLVRAVNGNRISTDEAWRLICAWDTIAEDRAVIRRLVDEQAEDEGLWFVADSIVEAYLQQQLRRLHAVIEGAFLAEHEPVAE